MLEQDDLYRQWGSDGALLLGEGKRTSASTPLASRKTALVAIRKARITGSDTRSSDIALTATCGAWSSWHALCLEKDRLYQRIPYANHRLGHSPPRASRRTSGLSLQ
jgi:hypothetical protein